MTECAKTLYAASTMKYIPAINTSYHQHDHVYSRAINIIVRTDYADRTAITSYWDNDTSVESSLSVKSVARQTAVRSDDGKVEPLWSGLANRRSFMLVIFVDRD
ncbi:MAG: hypothetical protein ACLRQ0_13655 [Monoglobales bacterium]